MINAGFFLLSLTLCAQALFAIQFNWAYPLDGKLNADHYIEMYPYHPGGVDYTGGYMTYNMHPGTDFYICPPWESMDRGVTIRAVADGIVNRADHLNQQDRSYNTSGNNTIEIIHNDSFVCQYSHCRYNSALVNVGDSVFKGQPLALMGSTGDALYPHLHFAIVQPRRPGPDSAFWDPNDTSGNRHYWPAEYPYSGDVFGGKDLRIFTETGLRFSWSDSYANYPPSVFFHKRDSLKLHPPAVFGLSETRLFVYWSIHNQPGSGSMILQLLNPRDSVFFSKTYNSPVSDKLEPVDFASKVDAGQKGAWKIRLMESDTVVRSVTFQVGDSSIYAPHFTWEASKSIRVGEILVWTMNVDSLGGTVTFDMGKPTTAFQIKYSPLRIVASAKAVSDQPYRSEMVPIVASNGTGYTDTFRVNLVDFSKPIEGFPRSGVQTPARLSPAAADALFLPNPYSPGSAIRVSSNLQAGGGISIFDPRGRLVRRLPFDRGQKIAWDGQNRRGIDMPAGLLIFRCEIDGMTFSRKVVFLP